MRILPDPETLSNAAAELITVQANNAIGSKGIFTLVLSGGSTPQRTYELISTDQFRKRIEWDKVHVFWGDERCVKPDDPRRNERMAHQTLIDNVPIPSANVHPICFASTPGQSAQAYESSIKSFFGSKQPIFDMVLLGLGEDGHTASLFPGSDALKEDKRWIVETRSGKEGFERVTMTPVIINQAASIVFLVSGKEKADIFHKVSTSTSMGTTLPVQLIHPSKGKIVWLVDKAASGLSS